MSDRAIKWTRKYNDMMDCFNEEMYDDAKCFKSPALDDYSYPIPQMTKEDEDNLKQALMTRMPSKVHYFLNQLGLNLLLHHYLRIVSLELTFVCQI